MTAPYVRTADDARYRPAVGDVSTLAMYGLTLTVVDVSRAGKLVVRRSSGEVHPMTVEDWAAGSPLSRRVWTWTPVP